MSTAATRSSNFDEYTKGALVFFKFIGLDFRTHAMHHINVRNLLTILTLITMELLLILFLVTGVGNTIERNACAYYVIFFSVALGKILSMRYNHPALIVCHETLSSALPSDEVQQHFKLDTYLLNYKRIENTLSKFFHITLGIYFTFPLLQTLLAVLQFGDMEPILPLPLWSPIPQDNVLNYMLLYMLQLLGCLSIGYVTLSADLYLYSGISQLCVQFDWLTQRILELKPEQGGQAEARSIAQLKEIVRNHQTVLQLADDINRIFTPSIIFALLSSSFILCLGVYQIVHDFSPLSVIKVLILLGYESKEVFLTCYFGDKLVERSMRMFDALFMHDWYNGSLEYKRIVITMIMRTRLPTKLKVASIADISFLTLKQVLSIAYQAFTVLRTVE